jgi:hypothetical protein
VELVSLEEIINSLKEVFKEADDDDDVTGYKTSCILDALELNGEELIIDIECAVATHEAREAARPATARNHTHQLLLQQFENLSRVLHQEIIPYSSPYFDALNLSFTKPPLADSSATLLFSRTILSLIDLSWSRSKSWRAPINMTSLYWVPTPCSIFVSHGYQSGNPNRMDKAADVRKMKRQQQLTVNKNDQSAGTFK